MLDQLDLDRAIDKHEYQERLPELQRQLFDTSRALLQARVPALILFEGWAGTSKIGTIGLLTRRLDPRGLRVHSITSPRTFETHYPWLYRFWLKIPSEGQLGIFDRSWYREVLSNRTHHELSANDWRSRCEDIVSFERQLADNGTVIIKFWLHISKKEQAQRFHKLESDPITAWQVTDEDRWQHNHYHRVSSAMEDLLTRTDTPHAPWHVLPATDKRYARITVLETIIASLQARVGSVASLQATDQEEVFDINSAAFEPNSARASDLSAPNNTVTNGYSQTDVAQLAQPGILSRLDLTLKLDRKSYENELNELQAKLHLLGLQIYRQKRPVVLVFEGWDAAGKGGAIKRLTEKLDPRAYVVHAIAAPAGEDKERHYLYRFWRRLPPQGQLAIFDRSWYGRVLVERVEGYARPDEWQRAYAEMNEFERQLVSFGMLVYKFWLHLSPEEQLRRFQERQTVSYKNWKLTDEDWRNREKWQQYEQAADEMLLRTSTPAAPWTVVEAEDKRFARIKVLRTVVRQLEDELGKVKL